MTGPYFFEENGKPCNVNAQKYLLALKTCVIKELKERKKSIFQQDCATAHINKTVKNLLKKNVQKSNNFKELSFGVAGQFSRINTFRFLVVESHQSGNV